MAIGVSAIYKRCIGSRQNLAKSMDLVIPSISCTYKPFVPYCELLYERGFTEVRHTTHRRAHQVLARELPHPKVSHMKVLFCFKKLLFFFQRLNMAFGCLWGIALLWASCTHKAIDHGNGIQPHVTQTITLNLLTVFVPVLWIWAIAHLSLFSSIKPFFHLQY